MTATEPIYAVVPLAAKTGDTASNGHGGPAETGTTPDDAPALINFSGNQILEALANLPTHQRPWTIAVVARRPNGSLDIAEVLDDPLHLTERLGPQAPQLSALAAAWPGLDAGPSGESYRPGQSWGFDEILAFRRARRAVAEVLDNSGLEYGWEALQGEYDGAEFAALAARHLITPGTSWDQEAYDRLTREYRANVGKLHPDDADLRQPSAAARPAEEAPTVKPTPAPLTVSRDTEMPTAGAGGKNWGRWRTWILGAVAAALLATVLYQLVYEPRQPASNDEIRDTYGVTVFSNPDFAGDTFLMYSEDKETEGLAAVCDRPAKRTLADKPDLNCYVPGIDK